MMLSPENRIVALRETTWGQEARSGIQEQAFDLVKGIGNDLSNDLRRLPPGWGVILRDHPVSAPAWQASDKKTWLRQARPKNTSKIVVVTFGNLAILVPCGLDTDWKSTQSYSTTADFRPMALRRRLSPVLPLSHVLALC